MYRVANTESVHAGDGQLPAPFEAQNFQATDAESVQAAWDQYQMTQQHGVIDNTDGSLSGHAQLQGMSCPGLVSNVTFHG